jgi:hypothetical protein
MTIEAMDRATAIKAAAKQEKEEDHIRQKRLKKQAKAWITLYNREYIVLNRLGPNILQDVIVYVPEAKQPPKTLKPVRKKVLPKVIDSPSVDLPLLEFLDLPLRPLKPRPIRP